MTWVAVGTFVAGAVIDNNSGGGGDINVQSESTLTPEQRQQLIELIQGFSDEGGGVGFEAEGFPGQLSAGLSEGEQLSLSALEQRSLNAGNDPLNREGNEALLEILQGRGSTVGFEDFFNTNIQQPAVEAFSEDVLPSIIRDFGGAQFASSERQTADTNARDDLLSSLTRSRSDLAFQDRNVSMDRLLEAIGIQGDRRTGETDEMIKLLDSLGLGREVEQEGLDREFLEFVRKDEARNTRIAQILASLGITGTENIAAVGSNSSLMESLLGGVASGVGSGLGQRAATPKPTTGGTGTTP